mmetsp:Transcript_4107/g.9753  ORF Transcript_4107/g.9753 Transcript_4107/m.9753 type:complete len:120 (-) Transcript_4107:418-777(-)
MPSQTLACIVVTRETAGQWCGLPTRLPQLPRTQDVGHARWKLYAGQSSNSFRRSKKLTPPLLGRWLAAEPCGSAAGAGAGAAAGTGIVAGVGGTAAGTAGFETGMLAGGGDGYPRRLEP